MSYQVRNPTKGASRQRQRELINLLNLEDHSSAYQAIPGDTQKRVTNFSNDKKKANETTITFEDAVNAQDPNQPIVSYSTRSPYYPTSYSCEHSLFYERNGIDETIADTFQMLSHSEDADNSRYTISLHEIPVRLSLEFEIPVVHDTNDHSEIISNVEALQWSLLNKISSSSGLSKGCKIEKQYDGQTLVSALTNINRVNLPSKMIDRRGKNNDSNNNRKLNRSGNPVLTLPYPTSVYSIASTRPKWIGKYDLRIVRKKYSSFWDMDSNSFMHFVDCSASCSNEIAGEELSTNECFTAEINFQVKYRGNSGENDLIEEYIQSIIQNQIILDPAQLFAAHINGLKWVSNDDASTNINQGTKEPIYEGPDISVDDRDSPPVNAISESNNIDASNTLWANILIPICTVALLGVIWFFIHKHYRGKQRNGIKKTTTEDSDETDIETGSAATGLAGDLQSRECADLQESDEGKSCTIVMAEAMGLHWATASTVPLPTKQSASTSGSAIGLPPRPIQTTKRMISKQLKKKRRKKKGKKKQVLSLTRVDSRKNIVEMPMISESESECDSHYSSGDEKDCDDGSSYDASSGCSTPVSSSRNSSSTSSPQKSPRNETNVSDIADRPHFEFLMDAPEFLKDSFPDSSTSDDENLASNVSLQLQPRSSFEIEDVLKPHLAESSITKKNGLSHGHRLPSLEIDEPSELSSSFTEEHGDVMERMLPLPWLKPNNKKRFV